MTTDPSEQSRTLQAGQNDLVRYIDLARVGALLQGISAANGVATAVVDLGGRILMHAAFTPLCSEFHRRHPDSAVRCEESDSTFAASMLRGDEGALFTCLNGLTCGVAPIIVDGRHHANALIGQFFLAQPDERRFVDQAERWGFDTDDYLTAIRRLPVISETRAQAVLDVLVLSIRLLTEMGREAIQRRGIERELRFSEARYRSLFEDSPVAMWEEDHSWVKTFVDQLAAGGVEDIDEYLLTHPNEYALCLRHCRTLSVNRAAVQLYDAQDHDDLVSRADEIDLEFSQRKIRKFWAAMAAGEHRATYEEPARTLTGRPIHVRETCTAAPGHEQTFDRVYIADLDITDHRRAEESLVHANRLLRIVSEVNEMIVRETSIDRLLEQACRIFVDTGGFAAAWIGFCRRRDRRILPAAFAGADVFEDLNVSYDDSSDGRGASGTAVRTGQPVVCENFTTDESMVPWQPLLQKLGVRSAAAIPIHKGGEIVGVLSVYAIEPGAIRTEEVKLLEELADDIGFALHAIENTHVREQNEEALRASETRYRRIVETAAEGMTFLEAGGRISYANEEFHRLVGYDADELDGSGLELLLFPEDTGMQLRRLAALPPGEVRRYEVRLRCKDDSARWTLISAQATADDQGKSAGVFAMVTDIHDRKMAERRAARTLERLRVSVNAAVGTLARTIEMRDPYTAGHQERVTELTLAIARDLHLPARSLTSLRIASLIHDLGKIAVPAELLAKPGALNPTEWLLIRQHPETGHKILHEMKFPGPVATIVRQHHERLDGSGYPFGLGGDQIRLESRILAVADVVEAMASHRPYRPALGIDAALNEVVAQRGVLYDPHVVDACAQLFRQGFQFSRVGLESE